MEMIGRRFRLESSSTRLARSNNTLLNSELMSSAKISGYQRLSRSLSLPASSVNNDGGGKISGGYLKRSKTKAWTLFNKVFSTKKSCGGAVAAAKEVRKSWREAWMPDPNRRWPVQGW